MNNEALEAEYNKRKATNESLRRCIEANSDRMKEIYLILNPIRPAERKYLSMDTRMQVKAVLNMHQYQLINKDLIDHIMEHIEQL